MGSNSRRKSFATSFLRNAERKFCPALHERSSLSGRDDPLKAPLIRICAESRPKASVRRFCNSDQRGTKKTVFHHVARLHFLDDRSRFAVRWKFDHCLMAMRVELFPDRFHSLNAVLCKDESISLAVASIPARNWLAVLSDLSSSPTAVNARSI